MVASQNRMEVQYSPLIQLSYKPVSKIMYCLRVSPIELMIQKRFNNRITVAMSNKEFHPWMKPLSNRHAHIFAHPRLNQRFTIRKKQQSERDGARSLKKASKQVILNILD